MFDRIALLQIYDERLDSVESKLKVGDRAPESILLDVNGQPVALAETWRDGPVLLTFLRHFG